MKKLPEVNESLGHLFRILLESMKSKLLLTAIELKVFNQLTKSRSAEAVAEVLGTHPENTKLFLNGLAACDLVRKKKGLYQNRPDDGTRYCVRPGRNRRCHASCRFQVCSLAHAGYMLGSDGLRHWAEGVKRD